MQDVTSFWWQLWQIIYLRKLVISRLPEFWTRIQFAKVQTCQCLQMIHIFKSLFWCNDPTSCSWVDEVGDNNDGENIWSWYTEWSTFSWRYGIVINITFFQLWMVASSKTRKYVWLYFHHTFQWQYFWCVWMRIARQGCKDYWRDHGGRALEKISWQLRSTQVTDINRYVSQLINKKHARAIIDLDDHIYISVRRGCKA